MIVGITYDLRKEYLEAGFGEEETAEFDCPETIEAIEQCLQNLGFATDRIGAIKRLTARLAHGDRWDIVFNIAEGLRGFGREAQVPCLLDAYQIPYTFSDPLVLSLTLHKGLTKRVIRDSEIPTPAFIIIEAESQIETVDLPFPLFAKPVAEGTGKGITASSKIHNQYELTDVCKSLLAHYHQPVLIETFLPGREITVGIIGTGDDARIIGVMEVLFNEKAKDEIYSFFNKENYKEIVKYRLVQDPSARKAGEIALSAWRGLGCKDAGRVDLREDAQGIPNFLEINPLAGLHPENSDLPILSALAGIAYPALIEMIMESAMKRIYIKDSPLVKSIFA